MGRLLNIEDEAIIKGIEEFKLTNKRMDISTLKMELQLLMIVIMQVLSQ